MYPFFGRCCVFALATQQFKLLCFFASLFCVYVLTRALVHPLSTQTIFVYRQRWWWEYGKIIFADIGYEVHKTLPSLSLPWRVLFFSSHFFIVTVRYLDSFRALKVAKQHIHKVFNSMKKFTVACYLFSFLHTPPPVHITSATVVKSRTIKTHKLFSHYSAFANGQRANISLCVCVFFLAPLSSGIF